MDLKRFLPVVLIVHSTLSLNAGVLTVTSLLDSGPGTLRDRVLVSLPGDEIVFGLSGTIPLSSSISIGKNLFIHGPGPAKLVVDANQVDRAFITAGAPVIISGITISNGLVIGANGVDGGFGQNGTPGADALGGAIWNNNGACPLILSNCWLVGNTVRGGIGGRGGDNPIGAGFTPGTGGAGGAAQGGALYSIADVQILNCTFSDNHALGGPGGAGGNNNNLAVNKAGGTGGAGGIGKAGAIFVSQGNHPAITNCTYSGNTTTGGGGGQGGNNLGAFPGGQGGAGGNGECGAVSVGICVIVSCTIVSNSANGGPAGPGGTGVPNGVAGLPGSGFTGGLCAYNVACTVAHMGNSIVADNFASTARSNIDMYLTDYGYNFIGDQPYVPSCGNVAATRIGTVTVPLHAMLGPLAQNGGGLPTHAPLNGSPVIDWGHSLGTISDERRALRPFDDISTPNFSMSDGSDIGAFEFGSPPLGMSQNGGSNVVVFWPAAYGDFLLQSTFDLMASNGWDFVPDAAVVIDDQLLVTNRNEGERRFYRLIRR